MRLVLYYQIGDGCTYGCDVSLPVEYESAGALLRDLESAVLAYRDEHESLTASITRALANGYTDEASDVVDALYMARGNISETFECGTTGVWLHHFIENKLYCAPSVFTIDEWFDYHKSEPDAEECVEPEEYDDSFVFDCSNCGYHEPNISFHSSP